MAQKPLTEEDNMKDPPIIPVSFYYEKQPFHEGLLPLSDLPLPLLTPFI